EMNISGASIREDAGISDADIARSRDPQPLRSTTAVSVQIDKFQPPCCCCIWSPTYDSGTTRIKIQSERIRSVGCGKPSSYTSPPNIPQINSRRVDFAGPGVLRSAPPARRADRHVYLLESRVIDTRQRDIRARNQVQRIARADLRAVHGERDAADR